jgi:broad specificity phosphatase PhoE
MESAIILIRHGQVAIASDGLFSREAFLRYLEEYDAAPLCSDSRPAEELSEQLRLARGFFASELPRSRESARMLSIESEIRCEAIFNEESHHVVPRVPFRMPLLAWFAWSRVSEAMSPSLRRAIAERGSIAATRLIVEAHHGPTALIGHGWFNRAIARSLVESGWTCAVRHGGSKPWSFYVFTRE